MTNKSKVIFLTGFMGSGKSTIGPPLAKDLGFDFFDIDAIIEQSAGKSIPEIFQQESESLFRALEKQVLLECVDKSNCVISLGGGTLIDPENVDTVKQSGLLIYLSTKPNSIWDRVKKSNIRPLLQKSDGSLLSESEALHLIEQLLAIRQKGYNNADVAIPTDGKSIDNVLRQLHNHITDIM